MCAEDIAAIGDGRPRQRTFVRRRSCAYALQRRSVATAGYGTALGVIRAAVAEGKKLHVYVDETRPVLQGARLTAWK